MTIYYQDSKQREIWKHKKQKTTDSYIGLHFCFPRFHYQTIVFLFSLGASVLSLRISQVLMGQKYGYRPIPAFIEAQEFETLRRVLVEDGEEDLSVLDLWYLKDSNSVPPQYVLQPIDSILKNYDSLVRFYGQNILYVLPAVCPHCGRLIHRRRNY